MRRPDKPAPAALRPMRRARARAARPRSRGQLSKGSFIFLPLAPIDSHRRSCARHVSACHGRTCQRLDANALDTAERSCALDAATPADWMLHMRLAAPAKPNTTATLAARMSLAGLVCMHVAHGVRWHHRCRACRRLECGCLVGSLSRPVIDTVVHGPYQTLPSIAMRSEKLRRTGKCLVRWTVAEELTPHRYIGSRRMCRPDCHARGHACRVWQDAPPPPGEARAWHERLTAAESARTVRNSVIKPQEHRRG